MFELPNKVILDTNILLACSIIETSGVLGFEVKHDFYECSNKLMDYLKMNISKRSGIITNTIENQAYFTITQAVEDELKKNFPHKEEEFPIFSVLLNICNENLRNILQYLIREPIDQNIVREIYSKVTYFFDGLFENAKQINQDLQNIVNTKIQITPTKFRKIAKQIYKQQNKWKYAQLLHLLYKNIENSDKWILSEVIYLDKIYKPILGSHLNTYIASTDYHFSPIRKENRVSSFVTDAIYREYNIKCTI